MDELIGKIVEVHYVGKQNQEYILEGKVRKVLNNLVFLNNVRMYRGSWFKTNDQIVNTCSSSFIRFDILN